MARKSNASSFRFINTESRAAAKETYRFESEFLLEGFDDELESASQSSSLSPHSISVYVPHLSPYMSKQNFETYQEFLATKPFQKL
jgi:hypothetical protein